MERQGLSALVGKFYVLIRGDFMPVSLVAKVDVHTRCVVGGQCFGPAVYENVPIEMAKAIVKNAWGNLVVPATPPTVPQAAPKAPAKTAAVKATKALGAKTKTPPQPQPAPEAGLQLVPSAVEAVESEEEGDELGPDPAILKKLSEMTGPLPDGLPGKEAYEAAGIVTIDALISLDGQILLEIPGITPEIERAGEQFILAYAAEAVEKA